MTAISLDKHFAEWGGLDYRSNDETRKERFAREVLNVEYLKNNSLGCRKGFKGYGASKGGGGLHGHIYRDSSGVKQESLLALDSNLWAITAGAITVTYSGSASSVTIAILPELTGTTYSFRCRVMEDDTEVLDYDLGTGVDEAVPVTVANLVTQIDGLANFAATASGTTTGPAAFIDNFLESAVTGLSIPFEYWTQIYSPTTNPFSVSYALFNSSTFQIASCVSTGDRAFFATGSGQLYKFDGVSTFAAGMPAATTLSGATTAGALTGDYEWMITYEQIDALNKIVEGDESNTVELTLAAHNGRITIPQLQPSSGYLTSCALVNGLQAGVTQITVTNSPHTLQVGQTAFFRDNAGTLQERLITARTATTITISGAVVTVANATVISANLRVNLWRTKLGAPERYLVRTFANNSLTASVTYDDSTADASLGEEYEPPVEGHGTPPTGLKYLTVYKSLLIGSDGSDTIYFSDLDGPEYWNSSFTVRSKTSHPVSGLGANKDILAVFKRREVIAVIADDLSAGRFRQEELASGVGCESHHSIIDIEGTLWFFDTAHGPRRIVSVGLPDDVSYRLLPVFAEAPSIAEAAIVSTRVIAFDYRPAQLALFFVPSEQSTGGVLAPNEYSRVFACDYRNHLEEDPEYDREGRLINTVPKTRWWRWDNMNMAGGIATFQDRLVWTQRSYSSTLSAMEYPLCRRCERGDETDYADHAQPITWLYESSWYDLGEPDVPKKFIEIFIYSFPVFLGGAFGFTAQTELDFINGSTDSEKEIDFGDSGVSSGWGFGAWGDFPWGDPDTVVMAFELLPTKAKALKLVLSAEIFLQCPVVSGWSISAVPVYKAPNDE